MSACIYVVGKCLGLGVRGISPCADRSCPGPKGAEFPAPAAPAEEKSALVYVAHAPEPQPKKQAAPVVREEVKTMPVGQPAEIGTCEKCLGEGEKLYRSQSHPGAYCKKCNKAAQNRANNAKRDRQQGTGTARPASNAVAAAPSKPVTPIADDWPARDRETAQRRVAPMVPPPTAPPLSTGRAVTLVLTVHTIAALRQVLALTDGLDGVSVGLEG